MNPRLGSVPTRLQPDLGGTATPSSANLGFPFSRTWAWGLFQHLLEHRYQGYRILQRALQLRILRFQAPQLHRLLQLQPAITLGRFGTCVALLEVETNPKVRTIEERGPTEIADDAIITSLGVMIKSQFLAVGTPSLVQFIRQPPPFQFHFVSSEAHIQRPPALRVCILFDIRPTEQSRSCNSGSPIPGIPRMKSRTTVLSVSGN